MKLNIFKLLLIAASAIIWGSLSSKTFAYWPGVNGYVLADGSNAPISGVWVKWTDSLGNYQYMQTDFSGLYNFPGVDDSWWSARGMDPIDTNLDGSADDIRRVITDQTDLPFACRTNPQIFTVMQSSAFPGYFSYSTLNIDNVTSNQGVPTIYYYSYPVPTPALPPLQNATEPKMSLTTGCLSGKPYVEVDWTTGNSADFDVIRKDSSGIQIIASMLPASSSSPGVFRDTNVTPGTTYSYMLDEHRNLPDFNTEWQSITTSSSCAPTPTPTRVPTPTLTPTPTSILPTPTIAPPNMPNFTYNVSYVTGPYSLNEVTIWWVNRPYYPVTWVDISDDSSFMTKCFHKFVPAGSSVDAPINFNGFQGSLDCLTDTTGQTLTATPGQPYYVRLYNGLHSPVPNKFFQRDLFPTPTAVPSPTPTATPVPTRTPWIQTNDGDIHANQ